MAAEPVRAAFREATDLVQESTGKVRDAWSALDTALRDLLRRSRRRLGDDAMARAFGTEIEAANATVDELLCRMRPDVEAIVDTLTATADRSVPVLALFDAAIALGDAAEHLAGLSAEMTGRGDLEAWSGAAREGYDQRVRRQIGAADATADEVAAAAGWLSSIGAANTAYVTNVGHLGAELVGMLAEAAVEAVEASPGEVPRLVTRLERIAAFLDSSRERVAGWTRDLQDHFTAARENVPRFGDWPAATA
ncbi:hypothetical protein [Paractinoplanes globisporus]|uniref:Uncharacterized protein n=1 Tax=Paractinoplanes globisporus TaxID=113565 RepID=A0ABW6WKQ9_9ACTN|nr:hypothetical protein [Actinoplanes globisporus]